MSNVGLCECGCGQRTEIAYRNLARCGWVKGEPRPRAEGHRKGISHRKYVIDEASGCWIWQRSKNNAGYGQMAADGELVFAHRRYYELHKGPIPEGLELDHLCRNPACVNPDHLEPVTRAENSRRGLSAKLTEGQVREIRAASGSYSEFALRYGVSKGCIQSVLERRSWKDVA